MLYHATGKSLEPTRAPGKRSPWPVRVKVDVEDVPVGIALTQPEFMRAPFADASLPFFEASQMFSPEVDITERKNEVIVREDLPGMERKILTLNCTTRR